MLLAEKQAFPQQEPKTNADDSDVVTCKRHLTTNASHVHYTNVTSTHGPLRGVFTSAERRVGVHVAHFRS